MLISAADFGVLCALLAVLPPFRRWRAFSTADLVFRSCISAAGAKRWRMRIFSKVSRVGILFDRHYVVGLMGEP